MAAVLTPNKVTVTTTPKDTFVKVPTTLTDGVLLYRPENNSFIALYPEEWNECRAEGHQNKTAIEELQEANQNVTEKSIVLHNLLKLPNAPKQQIAAARQDLDKALNELAEKSEAAKKRIEAITDQKVDQKKLVELVPLTMKRVEGKPLKTPIYIKADKLKNALADHRFYLVEGATERKKPAKEKLFDGMTLNHKEVHNRIKEKVQDKAKFEKKWKWAPKDAEQFSGILTEWAKVMGTDATAFLERKQMDLIDRIGGAGHHDKDDAHRNIDLKSEAQFMRWAAGAGAEANFMPFQGSLYDKRDKDWSSRFKRAAKSAQFGVKANAEASFAVGEAKVETIGYYPHAAGWHLESNLAGQELDFGFFRLRGNLSLYAMCGASIALEAGMTLMVVGDKQGLKGTPKDKAGAKGKVGAKAEAAVFAGLKEGIDVVGGLQWLNPEGLIDPGSPKRKDPHKAIAEYADVATVSGGLAAIQGLAAKAGFECDYRDGSFVIAAKAGLCLGMGGSGSFAFKVGAAQISQFFMCIAHQLKHADFKKIEDMMRKDAFKIYNQILYLAVMQQSSLESFIGWSEENIQNGFDKMVDKVKSNGKQIIEDLERHLRSGWGWFAYLPPEARGAVIASVSMAMADPRTGGNESLRLAAAFSINELVATTQTPGHLSNTLERITLDIGSKLDENSGAIQIASVVRGTEFQNCVSEAETKMNSAYALVGRPYIRNDENQFVLAQLGLDHPGYAVA